MAALRDSNVRWRPWWTALLVPIALGGEGIAVAAAPVAIEEARDDVLHALDAETGAP